MTTIIKNTPTDLFLDNIPQGASEGVFNQLKTTAVQKLRETGLPKAKDEEYKYTPISRRIESSISNFQHAAPVEITQEQIAKEIIPGMDAEVLVFNNGHFDAQRSRWDKDAIQVALLSEASEEALAKGFGSIAKIDKDPFTALNTASFEDGVFIDIPQGKTLKKPILLLSFNQSSVGQTVFSRVFINIEKHSEITFIEKIISLDEEVYFLNDVTEISVAENAHLYYYKLQQENRNSIEVSNFETDIHQNGTFSSGVVSLSGGMIRNNLSLNLLGSNCEGNMYGLYLLNGKTHVDNHTNVDHILPHSESNELYKGILADNSRGVFNGKIFVRQEAQKTNAFQQNNNILLSEDAILNTKPQLEIWADDVKCSHGCTAGQMDDEALFYLQARGIGKEMAKGLLLFAFAEEVLSHIKNEEFRSYCSQQVQERLGSGF